MSSSPPDSGAAFESCIEAHQDIGIMRFASGMSVASSDGTRVITVVANHPGVPPQDTTTAPPVRGSNTWDLRITDASGSAVDGLEVTASVSMPDHNHATPVQPQVTPGTEAGQYVATPLYLFMSGYWKIDLQTQAAPSDAGAAAGSTAAESVTFKICVP
jgi:hypothetical protein